MPCFWNLTQGKDLMVISLENRDVFTYFIIAQVFWSYVTWYTSRLVGKVEEFESPCEDPIWTTMRVQGPRLLAFTCFTIDYPCILSIIGRQKISAYPGLG